MAALLISLFIFIVLGIPIAFSLGLSSLLYFTLYHPELLSVIPQRVFAGYNNYSLLAFPLFVLMGQLMNNSGITRRIIDFSGLIFGRMKGGLGCVNVFGSMIFGGISGSSTADTASIGAVMIPEMEKRGYPKGYATGITVASSTMGMIIPPSVPMVLFAVTAQESVGRLFLGGLIPGVLIGLFQLVINVYLSYKRQYPAEKIPYSFRYVVDTVKNSMTALLMPVFVVGSVVWGIATSNESASFGVMYSLVIGGLIYRNLKLKTLPKVFLEAAVVCATIMVIIAFSQLYVWILALEQVPQQVAGWVLSYNLGPVPLMVAIMMIILIAGTFIDVSPAIILLTPVFLPAAMSAGISPLHFGGLLITGLAVGNVTPPVGSCLNVASAISGLSLGRVFTSALPFLLGNLLVLLLICFFPGITTELPRLLMP